MWLCSRVLRLLPIRNKVTFLLGKVFQFLCGGTSIQQRVHVLQAQEAPPCQRRPVTQSSHSWCQCLRVNDQLYHGHGTKFGPIRSQSETFTVVIGESQISATHLKGSNVNLTLSSQFCELLSERAYSTLVKKKKNLSNEENTTQSKIPCELLDSTMPNFAFLGF